MESTPAFAPPDGVRGAGAGRLLLLLAGQCWTSRWCARSWSWTATASTLMDEVYAFLHAAGWSWSWTPGPGSWTEAATTLLDEVCAFLRRRLRHRSTSSFAPPGMELELDSGPGELDGGCYYPTGRGLRLPSPPASRQARRRRRVARCRTGAYLLSAFVRQLRSRQALWRRRKGALLL